MDKHMVRSDELMELATSLQNISSDIKSCQYQNGTYSRTGGDIAHHRTAMLADKVMKMAQRMMYVEARLEAMTAVYPDAIVFVKGGTI